MPTGVYCPNCGLLNFANAVSCSSCGSSLQVASTDQSGSSYFVPQHGATSPSRGRRAAVILRPLLAVAVGIALSLGAREFGVLDSLLGEKVDVISANLKSEESFSTGRAAGYQAGFEEGDSLGYDRGFSEGKSAGYSEGESVGESVGYDRGYDVGFIDAKTSITPNSLNQLISSVSWSNTIDSSESGICVYFKNSMTPDSWKWAFIKSSGQIQFVSDSSGFYRSDNFCYTSDFLRRRVGALSGYERLAVYLTYGSQTDRWGPSTTPRG